MSRRRPRGYRKRQVPSLAVAETLERDLQRLIQWLEERRIKAMRLQRPEHILTVGRVNERLYPWYDKARTKRKEASPGLLLLKAAENRGLVRQTTTGLYEDIRHKSTIGTVVVRKGER